MSGATTARSESAKDGAELPKVDLAANGLRVLEARYLKRDEQGEFLETPAELMIQGTAVDPSTDISLDPGWHLVPYLHETPLPAADALASVAGQLTLAKDGWGNVYWPAYNVNSIGDLESGNGYQLLLHTGGTLSYPP